MTSNLPSRWQEILRREAAANVSNVLAQAKARPEPQRVPRWTVPVAVVAISSFGLLNLLSDSEATARGSVPFNRSAILSTRTAGMGASAEDLAPVKKKVEPLSPPVTPSIQRPSASGPLATRRQVEPLATPATPAPRCIACERRRLAEKDAGSPALEGEAEPPLVTRAANPAADPHVEPSGSPSDPRQLAARKHLAATPLEIPATPTPKPPPTVINVGTRLQLIVTDAIVTGAAVAPVTARTVSDVYVGDRLVVPAGTVLVGEGFATRADDRVQVIFTALVKDGKTLQFEGWALQDSEMGIPGKLIRKGSKVKGGAGTVLGAAASALTFGLAGAAGGPAGAALANLGSTTGSDLNRLGRDWRLSDKAVRVEAGASIIVYVRRDLTIE